MTQAVDAMRAEILRQLDETYMWDQADRALFEAPDEGDPESERGRIEFADDTTMAERIDLGLVVEAVALVGVSQTALLTAINRARLSWIGTHGVKGKGIDEAITDAVVAALTITAATELNEETARA